MNDENHQFQTLTRLRFFVSLPHECGYLPEEEATSLFVDPSLHLDMAVYGELARAGFRRSGEHVYRPHCVRCRACIPARIPVADFRPDRSQRRCRKRNADVTLTIRDAGFEPEHFRLYRTYMQARHPGGSMDDDDPAAYRRLIGASWSDTCLFESRLGDRLLAVAIVDRLPDGLSAVYTFFDPAEAARSPGTLAILQQVEQTRAEGLDYVYLGFWNPRSGKMAYKSRFRPLECFTGSEWQVLSRR